MLVQKYSKRSDSCRIAECGQQPFDLGLCRRHWSLFKRGRITLQGNLRPLTCRKCRAKFFYTRVYRRELCDACKLKSPRRTQLTRRQIKKQADSRRSEILKLRKQGLSMGVIGKLYGVSDERIRQILQANRITG